MMYQLKILWYLRRTFIVAFGRLLTRHQRLFELITFIINQYLFIFSQRERMPDRCRSQDDIDILLGRIHRGNEDNMDMKVYVDRRSTTHDAGTFSPQEVLRVGVETWEKTMMYQLKILWNLKRLLLVHLGGCLPCIKDSFELITFIINQYLFIFSEYE